MFIKEIINLMMKIVDQKQFGKDHWSLLDYAESRVHSHQVAPLTGELDKEHLRINPNGDYGVLATPSRGMFERSWHYDYGTRLKGYFEEGKSTDLTMQIPQHDDLNCLNDLEAVGLIEVMSLVNFFVKLTEKGQTIASELRKWKNKGGMFYNFEPSCKK